MNFNIEIGKMLEVISKEPTARTFAYIALFLGFILGTYWLAPDFLKALAEFIVTLR